MIRPSDLPESLDRLLDGMVDPDRESDRPWITLAYAQSLDGSIATRRGASLSLSNPASLKITHHLRARHAAILIGIGTLLADDPRLNVRLVPGEDPQPVILDHHLRTPLTTRLLQGSKPPWIMAAQQASAEREAALVRAGARVFHCTSEEDGLGEVLMALVQEGNGSVMVEGGARVIVSFLQARLVDLIVLTIAPRFVGGLHAVESLLPGGGPVLSNFGAQRYGNDLLVWGCPSWSAEV